MEEYNNLKMTMENRKQAIEAVEIIKNLASKRTPESPNELIHYLADVKIKKNMVIVDNSCSLFIRLYINGIFPLFRERFCLKLVLLKLVPFRKNFFTDLMQFFQYFSTTI